MRLLKQEDRDMRGLLLIYIFGSYLDLMLIRFGLADSALGRVSVRTPFVILASTESASMGTGRRRVRVNEP